MCFCGDSECPSCGSLQASLPRRYKVSTWFERDRAHVCLQDADTDEAIMEFWDGDVYCLIEDGFIDPRDWKGSMIDYAVHLGIIEE